MSDSESFIDEVSEEVRRDRLYGLMRRYGWIPVVVIVALVGGTAWVEWERESTRRAAQAQGDAVLAALVAEEGAARAEALDSVEANEALAPVLTLLRAAEIDDNKPAAAEMLMGVAADESVPRAWRDLAALKAVMLGPDAMEAEARSLTLERLADPSAPFAPLAREQQVYVLIEQGEREAALEAARTLLEEAGVTRGLQERLSQVIVSLGGKPEEG